MRKMDKYLEIFESIDFEKIIDHPNILIAASFWEEERYQAAKTCYKYLRAIDDLIDGHKAIHCRVTPEDRKSLLDSVTKWVSSLNERGTSVSEWPDLAATIDKFRIPLWPMEDFARSMIYDINNDGFTTFDEFVNYSQGASIAPASVFVHLTGIRKQGDGFMEPEFDVKRAATPCALFSYIVHIIRDFEKDQKNNLNYFAGAILEKNGLDYKALKDIADGGKIPDGFRRMIAQYCEIADSYRKITWNRINEIRHFLGQRYQLSLYIIFNLYLMVFERINAEKGIFSTAELNPTPEEIRQRVLKTIEGFRQG